MDCEVLCLLVILNVITNPPSEACFHYYDPRLWNDLLGSLRAAKTLDVFNYMLRNHLFTFNLHSTLRCSLQMKGAVQLNKVES